MVLRRGLQHFLHKEGEGSHVLFNYHKQLKGKLDIPSCFSQLIARDFVRDFFFDTLHFHPPTPHPFLAYFFFPLHPFISLSNWMAYRSRKKNPSTINDGKKVLCVKEKSVPHVNRQTLMKFEPRKNDWTRRITWKEISCWDAFFSQLPSFIFFTHFPSLLVCFSLLLTAFFTSSSPYCGLVFVASHDLISFSFLLPSKENRLGWLALCLSICSLWSRIRLTTNQLFHLLLHCSGRVYGGNKET